MRTEQKARSMRLANAAAETGDKKKAAYHLETVIVIMQAERDDIGRQIARLQRLHADFTGHPGG